MENPISISTINDFIFCPISIYFHSLCEEMDPILLQEKRQINGSFAHESIDNQEYSSRKDCLQGIFVYSEKYNLIGKIDLFDGSTGVLMERKKHISNIYDGYIFQLYAQYFSLIEMGYDVKNLFLYSYDDNKKYPVLLPNEDEKMFTKFEKTLHDMNNFNMFEYYPKDINKCRNCIYSSICDRGLNYD